MRLRFLTLRVAQAARSRRFYEALGLRPASGDSASLPMLDAGGVRLVLATDSALSSHAPVLAGPGGAVLISLNTDSPASVDAAWQATADSDGEQVKAPHTPAWGGRATWLRDPDGHPVEVVWNPGLPD